MTGSFSWSEDRDGLAEATAPGGEIPDTLRSVVRRPVELLAEGRGRVAVAGVEDGEWVVTLGQHLLQQSLDEGGGDTAPARVRPVPWVYILELEGLQREDLLEGFLAKQRLVARAFGAGLPANPAAVDEALRRAAEQPDDGSGAH